MYKPYYWWFEVYNSWRRLALTCVVVLCDTLAQTTIFVMLVSIVTLVFENQAQPYHNVFMNAFTHCMAWLIVMFNLYLLLLDAEMTQGVQAQVFSILMLATNITLVLVIFIDTRRAKTLRKLRSKRSQQARQTRTDTIVLEMRNVYGPSMTSTASSGIFDEGDTKDMGPTAVSDSPILKTGMSFRNPMHGDGGKTDGEKVARPTLVPDAIPRKGTIQVDFAETDWEQQWSDEYQRHYWFDHATGRSSWGAPPDFEPEHEPDVSDRELPDGDSIPRLNKALSTMTDPNSIHEEDLHDEI